VGYRVAAAVLSLIAFAGCTSAQRRAIAHALQPPPVDLRVVPTGLEVRFVCGPAVPVMSWVGTVREAASTTPTPTTYPDPRHAKAVRSIILPIPAAKRHVHLTGSIFVVGPNESVRGVPFGGYVFDGLTRWVAERPVV